MGEDYRAMEAALSLREPIFCVKRKASKASKPEPEKPEPEVTFLGQQVLWPSVSTRLSDPAAQILQLSDETSLHAVQDRIRSEPAAL